MQCTADVVDPKAKSADAVQWAHSSLSRIPYHQLITNEIRKYWSFGAGGSKTGQSLVEILTIVYADLPVGHLPKC